MSDAQTEGLIRAAFVVVFWSGGGEVEGDRGVFRPAIYTFRLWCRRAGP